MAARWELLRTAGLGVMAVGFLGTVEAIGQLLPGNFWPNPTLETPAAGDPTRPEGWLRGGGDYGSPGPFNFDFWDTASSVSPDHSLLVTDNSTGGNGEWFFENPVLLPAGAVPGTDLFIRMNRKWNVVGTPGEMRLSIVWHDGIGFFADTHFVVLGPPSSQQPTFLEETFQRTIPANATGMRIVVASGGGGDVTGFIAVDDISVSRIPEPAFLGLFGIAAVASTSRRLRRQPS